MFGFTKKVSPDQSAKKNNFEDQAIPSAFNVDEAPIYTMQEDLKLPGINHKMIVGEEKSDQPNQTPLPHKQSNSPLSNLADKNPLSGIIVTDDKLQPDDLIANIAKRTKSVENNDPMTVTRAQKRFEPEIPTTSSKLKPTPSMVKEYSITHRSWRLIFFSIFSSILLILLSWIGLSYYRDNNFNPFDKITLPLIKNTAKPEIQNQNKEPEQPVTLSYSQTSPNYLRLETSDFDPKKIKATLEQYMRKVSLGNYTAPIEFIVTDAQNKPLNFKTFSDLMGLKFSPALMALLGDKFSLYIHNDASMPKIGLSIESRDNINLAKVLLQEEKDLADEVNPLFFTQNSYDNTRPFLSTTYSGVNIRYQNIISPDNLSIDYSFYGNNLYLGVTKATMFAIIDKITTSDTAN
ncbi:MAG: hypothetical protein WC848_01970 [Parcubacteria group bacterium]|jgi:hypothetical protein